MQAIDLILEGYKQLNEDEDTAERYSDIIDEEGMPREIENDIEIENFYILPIESQLRAEGKQLCEAVYGVKVKVNKEVRLWRAETATFAKGIAGDGDIGAITARKVKEGTELDLTLFELFFQVCDIEHGLSVRVAGSEEAAYFTMKQGRYADGSKYPEMILRYSDEGIKERAVIGVEIDEDGAVQLKEEISLLPVMGAQALLNEVYPNNMYIKCRDIEDYLEDNRSRFKAVMEGNAQIALSEGVEEIEDTDIEVLRDEEEYFEYLYGNEEYEGILESEEDKEEYVEIKREELNAEVKAEEPDAALSTDTDIEAEEPEGYDYVTEMQAEEDRGIMNKETLLETMRAMQEKGKDGEGTKIGKELTKELLSLLNDSTEEEVAGIVIGVDAANAVMREVMEKGNEIKRAERREREKKIEDIEDLMSRVQSGKITKRDDTDMRKLVALAYREEYKEIFGGLR